MIMLLKNLEGCNPVNSETETHLLTGVEALRLRTDRGPHVTGNVWPDDGENDNDEKEEDAGDAKH
jgi:hypothetical protein